MNLRAVKRSASTALLCALSTAAGVRDGIGQELRIGIIDSGAAQSADFLVANHNFFDGERTTKMLSCFVNTRMVNALRRR
jgi:hypothetical protein